MPMPKGRHPITQKLIEEKTKRPEKKGSIKKYKKGKLTPEEIEQITKDYKRINKSLDRIKNKNLLK